MRARVAAAGCVALALLGVTPCEAQEPGPSGPAGPAAIRLSGFAGVSLREGPTGFAVARDVWNASVRLTRPRRRAIQPWVQAGRFVRPDLECPGNVPCNTDGWTVLGGVTLPLSLDETEPGVHPYVLAGVGAAFSAQNRFAYLFGFGTAVALTRRIAPTVELRWEDLPGIRNVTMLNIGLRVDLF